MELKAKTTGAGQFRQSHKATLNTCTGSRHLLNFCQIEGAEMDNVALTLRLATSRVLRLALEFDAFAPS